MKQLIRTAVLVTLVSHPSVHAYQANDQFAVGGVLAGAVQCQNLSDTEADDKCKGGLPFQPEFDFQPTQVDQMFFKLGFATGNSLNKDSPFIISPWAADLEDDVKDINGRNRDYLLNAWYKRSFVLPQESRLGVTLGLIDATDYMDENIYSNDEYTQFQNAALVNGPNVFLPSYDVGAAVQWDIGRWSLRGVYMNVGGNDDGKSFNFFGGQAGYRLDTSLGEGNYRALVVGSSSDFLNPEGTRFEDRTALGFSFDQQLGDIVGAFIRFGWEDDKGFTAYDAIYSGGIDINGRRWRRSGDNIGLGLAYLSGGNLDVDHSHVVEAYYRFVFDEHFALTADLQYMKDDYTQGTDPKGWIFSLRAVAEF